MVEVKRTLGNVTIDIYDEGEYNIDGKKVPHGAEIKIKAGKPFVKMSARDMLSLKVLLSDPVIRKELQARYDAEQTQLKEVSF